MKKLTNDMDALTAFKELKTGEIIYYKGQKFTIQYMTCEKRGDNISLVLSIDEPYCFSGKVLWWDESKEYITFPDIRHTLQDFEKLVYKMNSEEQWEIFNRQLHYNISMSTIFKNYNYAELKEKHNEFINSRDLKDLDLE